MQYHTRASNNSNSYGIQRIIVYKKRVKKYVIEVIEVKKYVIENILHTTNFLAANIAAPVAHFVSSSLSNELGKVSNNCKII